MRYEYKFYINERDFRLLKNDLRLIMHEDDHNKGSDGYHIRSIYFDDYKNSDYYRGIYGISKRKKYRIRFYDCNPSYILLEKKVKINNRGLKHQYPLHLNEYGLMMKSKYKFILKNKEIPNKIFYELENGIYKPKIIVDYKRFAYKLPVNKIRVTLDSKLKFNKIRNNNFSQHLGLYSADLGKQRILEVKFNNYLPNIIKKLLSKYSLTRVSISKYNICRQGLRNRG